MSHILFFCEEIEKAFNDTDKNICEALLSLSDKYVCESDHESFIYALILFIDRCHALIHLELHIQEKRFSEKEGQ